MCLILMEFLCKAYVLLKESGQAVKFTIASQLTTTISHCYN